MHTTPTPAPALTPAPTPAPARTPALTPARTPAPAPATLGRQLFTRRHFLHAATAATAGIVIGAPFISRAWAAAGAKSGFTNLVPANRRVRVACVGLSGRGAVDMPGAADAGAEIVALCDVDFSKGAKAFQEYPEAARFRDFRKMLDEMGDKIDALTISTTDHMHFPIALMAIERGKHVYVQKPLTHTIGEARALRAAAIKHGVVTQMGNQGHANEGTRLTKEWLEAGVIGTVREVHSWSNRPIWPQGIGWPKPGDAAPVRQSGKKNKKGSSDKSPAPAKVAKGKPDSLDWNLWLGVAPWRDFTPNLHPFNWRGFWDYGCGALGDMGCHIMDAPFWTLNLTGDCKVTAEHNGAATIAISAPKASTIRYEFPARGSLPPIRYTWYDGGRKPPAPKELEGKELGGGGSIYYGDKGVLYAPGDASNSPRLLPDSRMRAFTPDKRPKKTIPRVPKSDPYIEWISAIQGGGVAPGSNIVDHSAALTEFVSLGNVALRAGKPIQWDAATATCVGNPEAQIFINKNYRKF